MILNNRGEIRRKQNRLKETGIIFAITENEKLREIVGEFAESSSIKEEDPRKYGYVKTFTGVPVMTFDSLGEQLTQEQLDFLKIKKDKVYLITKAEANSLEANINKFISGNIAFNHK
jgi:hypothetical protein